MTATTTREIVAELFSAWGACVQLADELVARADALDELDEAIGFEQAGANVEHRFAGSPVPWMQQRLGEHVGAVRTAGDRLADAADDMGRAAAADGNATLERMARGFAALAGEAQKVVDGFAPWLEMLPVDWHPIDAIRDGLRRLAERHDDELRADLTRVLRDHDQRQLDLRAAGLGAQADVEDADPALRRALAEMRGYVHARNCSRS